MKLAPVPCHPRSTYFVPVGATLARPLPEEMVSAQVVVLFNWAR